jgi:hypothetical protein
MAIYDFWFAIHEFNIGRQGSSARTACHAIAILTAVFYLWKSIQRWAD